MGLMETRRRRSFDLNPCVHTRTQLLRYPGKGGGKGRAFSQPNGNDDDKSPGIRTRSFSE